MCLFVKQVVYRKREAFPSPSVPIGFRWPNASNNLSVSDLLTYILCLSFSLSRPQKAKPLAAAVAVVVLKKIALLEVVSPAALIDDAASLLVIIVVIKCPSVTMLALVQAVPLKAAAEMAVLKGPPKKTEEVAL